jgi:nicotinate-nucleotide--dimethylbenzimidazole phosphoribosyltransferase
MSTASQGPFDDIRALIGELPGPSGIGEARGGGALDPVAAWIGAWRGRFEVNRPILALYAAAHHGAGEAGETLAALEAIAGGQAQVARAAQSTGAGLDVFDLAVERPLADITEAAGLSERDCAATMAFGMEALAKQPDLALLAGFGAGAQEAALALALALLGEAAVPEPTPRIRAAAERARAEAGDDPLQLLRQLGGREGAALAGAILAAGAQRAPALLDGPAALAAAAVLARLDPAAVSHCRAAAPSPIAQAIGLASVCAADLGLEPGAGAMAALGLVRLACALAAPAAI